MCASITSLPGEVYQPQGGGGDFVDFVYLLVNYFHRS